MKIDIKVKELTIKDLEEGETFEYENGLYIKTDENPGSEYIICVHLKTGEIIHLSSSRIISLGPKLKIVLDE